MQNYKFSDGEVEITIYAVNSEAARKKLASRVDAPQNYKLLPSAEDAKYGISYNTEECGIDQVTGCYQ